MRWRPLVILFAGLMAASFAMPWIIAPDIVVTPSDGFNRFDWSLLAVSPVIVPAVLACFLLPGLLAVVALFLRVPRLAVLTTVLLPLGVALYQFRFKSPGAADIVSLPLPHGGPLVQRLWQLAQVTGIGAWSYAVGLVGLVLVVLLAPRRRRAAPASEGTAHIAESTTGTDGDGESDSARWRRVRDGDRRSPRAPSPEAGFSPSAAPAPVPAPQPDHADRR